LNSRNSPRTAVLSRRSNSPQMRLWGCRLANGHIMRP
jgi:hypothetical protein